MQKHFRISVDGHGYDVVVEEIAADAAHATAVPVVAVAAAAPVVSTVAAPVPVVHGTGTEVAPLAGVVESLAVTIGQTVLVGDKIATIEAMKMKTEVFAKAAGVVASIAVKPGDPVDSGGVILTFS
jgi:glutaconyl-CoA/methylmalonyl-CoA decarboxylase subunit gamma